MERKNKVGTRAANSGDNSGHRNEKFKKSALEKIYRMEFVRNKQESCQNARFGSKTGDYQGRKKYNNEEESYFEGTSVQKTKRDRKHRPNDNSPSIPTGFTVSSIPSAPPPVNAWTKKKGSSLFRREEEVDEDEMLRLALQESLKTHEEEERFRRNYSVPSQNFDRHKHWNQEDVCKEELRSSHHDSKNQSPTPDLHFVDTDSESDSESEETPVLQERKPLSSMNKKSSHFENNNADLSVTQKKLCSPPMKDTNYKNSIKTSQTGDNYNEFFEPSRPQEKFAKEVTDQPTYTESTYLAMPQRPFRIPEKDQDVSSINNDLSSSFKSNLTFGDTQDVFEKLRRNNNYKSSDISQTVIGETSSTLLKDSENLTVNPHPGSTPSETDIMLHNFIRHDPPSDTFPETNSSLKEKGLQTNLSETNNMFSGTSSQSFIPQLLNASQSYTTCEMIERAQHSLLNGVSSGNTQGAGIHIANGHDSGSSLSGSPPQNLSPYGSLEKQLPSTAGLGLPSSASAQVPFPLCVNAANDQETMNPNLQSNLHVNQNPGSPISTEPSTILPGIRPMMPLNSQIGIAPFGLPNSNLLMPQFQGHDLRNISPQAYQHYLMQQLQLMSVLNDIRLQQAIIATEGAENIPKEQHNLVNNTQVQNQQLLAQNQPQILLQNQQHVMQFSNQFQSFPTQNSSLIAQPLENVNQGGLQQQNKPLSGETPSVDLTKELYIKYQKTIQELNELTQQMHQAQIHSAQTQPSLIQPIQIHTSQIQPTHIQPLQIQPAQIQSTQIHPTQMQPTQIQPNQMQSTQIHPTQMQPTQIQPNQMQSTQIQPTQMQPTQIQPTQMQPTQIQPAQIQSSLATALFSQPPPGWGVYSPTTAVPLGMNQYFPGVPVITQAHPQFHQSVQYSSQLSPQETHSNLTGQVNIVPDMNSPNLNTVEGPDQAQTEPKIGRGRGRIP